VTDEIDIYRAAKLYIDQHGDLDGAATWRKFIAAIEVMQATEPSGAIH
jgi:hypothetical protein